MKKLSILVLISMLAVSVMSGCGTQQSEQPAASAEPSAAPEIALSVSPIEDLGVDHEGQSRSDLTGEWIDEELAAQRPFACMIGNTKAAIPQYGISQAGVIYEAPVEGSETRLMGIFQNYQELEKLMSVRSCRLYYIDWALEFDAIYGHYGQAYLAKSMLSQSYVHNLSGLDGGVERVMYSRDSSRKAPHNAYTTGQGIQAGIEYKGYETKHAESYPSHYNFNKEDDAQVHLTQGTDAVVVVPGYLVNKPWFVYDSDSGNYLRFQNGSKQIDGNDGKQLQVKNILIQICKWNVADQKYGYLAVNTTSGGKGYYVTNGKMIPITWSKESQKAPTKYYDESGAEITLNQGNTWVCITQDTYAEKIKFYASEAEFDR